MVSNLRKDRLGRWLRRSKSWIVAVGLALTFFGPTATSAQPPAPQPALVTEGRQVWEPHLKSLEASLERARGLKFKRPVQVRYCSQREAVEYLQGDYERSKKVEVEKRRELFFRHLGLLKPQEKWMEATQALYAEQVRGLYDPLNRTLLVVVDLLEAPRIDKMMSSVLDQFNIDLSDLLLVHELCHALQDQNFNLKDSLLAAQGNLDRELALSAAVEGDATQAMFDYLAQAMGLESQIFTNYLTSSSQLLEAGLANYPQLEKSPLIVRSLVVMPYFEGWRYTQTLRQLGGQKEVDRSLQAYPLSTEQILHPQKFIQNSDPALSLDLSRWPALIGEYRSLGQDSAGEYVVRVWASSYPDLQAQASRIAQGWAGDSFQIYLNPQGRSFGLWATLWDSQGDRQEFTQALRAALGNRVTIQERERMALATLDAPLELQAELRQLLAQPQIEVRPLQH